MKKFIITAVITVVVFAAAAVVAQKTAPPAQKATTSTAATAPKTQKSAAAANVAAPAAAPAPTPAQTVNPALPVPTPAPSAAPQQPSLSAEQIVNTSAKFYALYNFYSVRFELVQVSKTGGRSSPFDREKEKGMDIYQLIYFNNTGQPDKYLMRLSATKGHHNHTVVVYGPDKKGEYKYTFYKPAGTVTLPMTDLRVADLPQTLMLSYIGQIKQTLENKPSKVRVTFLPEIGNYAVEITSENQRDTAYFDAKTFQIVKIDTEINGRKGFTPMRSIAWREFVPNPQIKVSDITAKPVKP